MCVHGDSPTAITHAHTTSFHHKVTHAINGKDEKETSPDAHEDRLWHFIDGNLILKHKEPSQTVQAGKVHISFISIHVHVCLSRKDVRLKLLQKTKQLIIIPTLSRQIPYTLSLSFVSVFGKEV